MHLAALYIDTATWHYFLFSEWYRSIYTRFQTHNVNLLRKI